jgi:hypothetical protein
MKNRRKIVNRAKRRYKKLRRNPQFKRVTQRRLKNPKRHQRRRASDSICFAIGPEMELGWVDRISPEGNVYFSTEQGSGFCLPATSFIHHVVFLSEQDIDSLFEELDETPHVYEELEPEDIHGTADLLDIPWDGDNRFMDICQRLVGKRHLDDMTPEELAVIEEGLLAGRFDLRQASNLHLYDQGNDTSENKLEVRPDKPDEAEPSSDIPEVDDQGFPPRSTQVVPPDFHRPSRSKAAMTIGQILSNTGDEVRLKASGIRWKLSRADPKRGIWTFQVRGSKAPYTVRIKGIRKGNVRRMQKAQVRVSCTCPFFRWQGPEHWAKANRYLYGKPMGTATRPAVKDPKGRHFACKHLVAVFGVARNYRMASSWMLPGTEVEPEWSSPARVVERWLR